MVLTLPAESTRLSPLPSVVRQGLTAASTVAFISFFCSTGLFSFLSYRLWTWRRRSAVHETNQLLVLIYNLLFADIQQSLAFLLNVTALKNDAVEVGTSTCWAQGWFISTGDLASSIFITAIAVHTFMSICRSYRLPTFYFYAAIGALWAFVYFATLIGIGVHAGDQYYVRAGAWCWVNAEFSSSRLWSHYFWIFAAMVVTTILYSYIVFYLWRRGPPRQISSSSTIYTTTQSNPRKSSASVYLILLVYPTIYIVCTIPLAVGRIISMSGDVPSLGYFCIAGTLISCNGLFDVLLYSLTRRSIVFADAEGPSPSAGIDTFTFLEGMGFGNQTVIGTGGRGHSSSTEELYQGNETGIEVKAITTVVVEDTSFGMEMNLRGRGESGGESFMSRTSEATKS